MRKFLLSFLISAFTSLAIWADTWTDPNTGYTWTYRINSNGAEIYKVFDNGLETAAISPMPSGSVTIPNMLGSNPVIKIGNAAFRNCDRLTSLTIPNSVEHIGNQAFYNCSSLSIVTIPDSVKRIGSNAFTGCSTSLLYGTSDIQGAAVVDGL